MKLDHYIKVDGVNVITVQGFFEHIMPMARTSERIRAIAKVALALALASIAMNIALLVAVLHNYI